VNEHPEELLAEYAEGTLGADQRARVEEHLEGCETCREELGLAGEARQALAALPELEAPGGIPLAVRRKGRGTPSRAWQFVGAAAAAAVLVAGAVFVFSNLDAGTQQEAAGGGGGQDSGPARAEDSKAKGGGEGLAGTSADQEEAPALAAAPIPQLPIYKESNRRYESKDLAPLARRLRDDANGFLASGLSPFASAFFAEFDPASFTPEIRRAIRCVLTDVPPQQLIVPLRIEAASFQGQPAYIAAFLQGPTPDDEYDRIVMWVVHRESCDLISLASQLL
jgi:anti-sigma factor RsiW